jgi:tetratricopeptide (TPR) repeat protein
MRKMRYAFMILPVAAALTLGAVFFAHRSEGGLSSPVQVKEIVIPLGDIDRSALAEGDSLRKAHRYRDAIASYRKLLDSKGATSSILAEAEYDIGLSQTWLGENDEAWAVFTNLLTAYKDDPDAVGHAQFCLAWIEVQKGAYREAIARLEASLAKGNITDRELLARTRYMIGRTYLMFLDDPASANAEFRTVHRDFPDPKIAEHPYILAQKGK